MDIWQLFLQVLPVLLTAFFGFLMYAARIYLKTHVDHMTMHQKENILNTINSAAMDAIFYSEQISKNVQKNQMQTLKSTDKLETAVQYALDELKKNGITNLTPLDIERKIETILGSGTFETKNMTQSMEEQIKTEKKHLGDGQEE